MYCDTCGGGFMNVYDEDPNFVVSAKKLWTDNFPEEKPTSWTWLQDDEY